MSSYQSAEMGGINPEPQHNKVSRGEYMATGSEIFHVYLPVELISQGNSGQYEQNKFIVKRYSDTGGVAVTKGFSFNRTIAAVGSDLGNRMGVSDIRRDIALLKEGYLQSVYISGTNPAPSEMPIAPHPSGFQEWTPGKYCCGYVAADGMCYTGEVSTIYIDVMRGRGKITPHEETLTAWDGVAEATYQPYRFDYIYTGIYSYNIVPSGVTPSSGQVSVNFADTASGLVFGPGGVDLPGSIQVRYWKKF